MARAGGGMSMKDSRVSEIQALRVAIHDQERALARAKKSNASNAEIERIRSVLLRLEQALRELIPH